MNQNDCKKLSNLWTKLIEEKLSFDKNFEICQSIPRNHGLIEKKHLIDNAVNSKEKLKKIVQGINILIFDSYPNQIDMKWRDFDGLFKKRILTNLIPDNLKTTFLSKNELNIDHSNKYSCINIFDDEGNNKVFYIEKKNLKKYMNSLKNNK